MADQKVSIAVTAITADAERGLKSITDSMEGLGKQARDMVAPLGGLQSALGALGIGYVMKDVIDAALQMERLQRQFQVFTGSANLAGREMQWVKDQANRLGLDMLSLTTQYGQFMNAVKGTANEGEKGRAAFIGLSEGMAAIGMTADMQSRAWIQLNQGIMKGKFEMQDLKAINEAGLPIFKLMADAMGITTGELLKMQTEGKILANDVLPLLGESMHAAYAVAAAEGAKSAQGEINKMNNAMLETKQVAGAALIPVFTDIVKGIRPLLEMLKSFIAGIQILAVKAAALPDRVAAVWQVIKSGKGIFSKEGMDMYGGLKAGIDANEAATIDDAMKKYMLTSTDYTAAEAAAIKSVVPIAAAIKKGLTAHQKEMQKDIKEFLKGSWESAAVDLAAEDFSKDIYSKLKLSNMDMFQLDKQPAGFTKNPKLSLGVDLQLKSAKQLKQSEEDRLELLQRQRKELKYQLDIVKQINEAKAVNDAFTASQVGTNGTTGEVTDPYANQKAVADNALQETLSRIEQEKAAFIDLNGAKLESFDQTVAYIDAKDQQSANARIATEQKLAALRTQTDLAGWQGVLDHAKKAVPELAGFDKLLTAAFKDHTVMRKATAKEEAETGTKLVKDETASKLSMYGAFAGGAADALTGLAAAQDQSSRKGFENAKAFSMAAAVMSTAQAVMVALASPGSYIVNIALAASAAAMGAIQIAKIASTSFGGGGSVSAPSGSVAASGGGSAGGSLANVQTPMTSVEDSQVSNRESVLATAVDRNSVVIGKLSNTMEKLNTMFSTGGSGMGLATNAPGRFDSIQGADTFLSLTKQNFAKAGGTNLGGFLASGGVLQGALAMNSAIKTALFGGSVKSTGAGMSIDMTGGNASVQNYTDYKKKGGLLSSSSEFSKYSANQDASKYLTTLMKPFVKDLGDMANTLGMQFDVAAYKAKAVKIETSGKSAEDIGKELQTLMTDTLQGMALTIPGIEKLGGSYDNMFERITAVNNAYVTANAQLQLVGDDAIDFVNGSKLTGTAILDVAIAMDNAITSLYGGIDKYNETMDAYREVMYTQPERDAQDALAAKRTLNQKWAGTLQDTYGEMPTTIDGWNQLRNTIDPTSPLYKSVTELGTIFGTTARAAAEATDSLNSKTMELLSLKGLEDSAQYLELLNAQREYEISNMSKEEGAIQRLINSETDLIAAREKAAKVIADNAALEVRYLNSTGQNQLADITARATANQKEIDDAITSKKSLEYINKLKVTQQNEWNNYLLAEQDKANQAAAAITKQAYSDQLTALKAQLAEMQKSFDDLFSRLQDSAKIMLDGLKGIQDRFKSAAKSIRETLLGILTTDQSLSPEAKYNAAKKNFNDTQALTKSTDVGIAASALEKLGGYATELLSASSEYNASGADYAADYAKVTQALSDSANISDSLAEAMNPAIALAQKQVDTLLLIKDAVTAGDAKKASEYYDSYKTNETALKQSYSDLSNMPVNINEKLSGGAMATSGDLVSALTGSDSNSLKSVMNLANTALTTGTTGASVGNMDANIVLFLQSIKSLQGQIATVQTTINTTPPAPPGPTAAELAAAIAKAQKAAAVISAQGVFDTAKTTFLNAFQNQADQYGSGSISYASFVKNVDPLKLTMQTATQVAANAGATVWNTTEYDNAWRSKEKAAKALLDSSAVTATPVVTPPAKVLGSGSVTGFTDYNYAGHTRAYGVGDHRLDGDYNDSLSGLKIPNGYSVTLFDYNNYTNPLGTFTSDIARLPNGVNDAAASMRVEKLPGFATGTPSVPYDMTANIHQGEIIMDRASSDVLRKYGIPQSGTADNKETVVELKEQNKLLKALLNVTQAGLIRTAEATEKTAKATGGMEQKTRLQAAA